MNPSLKHNLHKCSQREKEKLKEKERLTFTQKGEGQNGVDSGYSFEERMLAKRCSRPFQHTVKPRSQGEGSLRHSRLLFYEYQQVICKI